VATKRTITRPRRCPTVRLPGECLTRVPIFGVLSESLKINLKKSLFVNDIFLSHVDTSINCHYNDVKKLRPVVTNVPFLAPCLGRISEKWSFLSRYRFLGGENYTVRLSSMSQVERYPS